MLPGKVGWRKRATDPSFLRYERKSLWLVDPSSFGTNVLLISNAKFQYFPPNFFGYNIRVRQKLFENSNTLSRFVRNIKKKKKEKLTEVLKEFDSTLRITRNDY